MVSIEPSALEFPFHSIFDGEGESSKLVYTKMIKIRNTTMSKARFGLQFATLQTDFEIVHHKSGGVFPGEYETVEVKFTPRSWDTKQYIFYVRQSKDDRLIPVYVTGI
jgi:hypothetical protein